MCPAVTVVALVLFASPSMAEQTVLNCKGTMANLLTNGESSYSANITLTKANGKVVKAVDNHKTVFVPQRTKSKDGSYYTQLIVEPARIILRYTYPDDDQVLDTVIENSGSFSSRLPIALVTGDCTVGKALF